MWWLPKKKLNKLTGEKESSCLLLFLQFLEKHKHLLGECPEENIQKFIKMNNTGVTPQLVVRLKDTKHDSS